MKLLTNIMLMFLALCLVTPAFAELELGHDPILKKIPAVENSWYYDFNQSELINTTGAKILGYKGLELSAAWGTGVGDEDRTENLVLGSLGYRLGALQQLLPGIELDYPLVNLIDIKPAIMVGYNIDRKEVAYGVGATVVQVKF